MMNSNKINELFKNKFPTMTGKIHVGDLVKIRDGIRCMDSGHIAKVLKVQKHKKYDYDVITYVINDNSERDGICSSLNDSSFDIIKEEAGDSKMKTNYTFKLVTPEVDDNGDLIVPNDLNNMIFFAGPCPRKNYDTDDWRFTAFDILSKLNFTGTVVTPTNPNFDKLTGEGIQKQTDWERTMMNTATRLVFWIPRDEDHPGFTTNVEFGEWFKKPGVYVGWPEGAMKVNYIEFKLKERGHKFYNDLEEMLHDVVEDMGKKHDKYFFTSDTHFNQQRTLELSRRPFYDLKEMDLTMISNWNKTVGINDVIMHNGDFGDLDKMPEILSNLNFRKMYFTLGNYERKDLPTIYGIIDDFNKKNNSRKIILKDNNLGDFDHFTLIDEDTKYILVHEPNDLDYATTLDDAKEYFVLFGHIHGRAFAKRDGIDIGTDYHNYTPLSFEQVKWFKNASKYWDENVYSDKCNISIEKMED